MCIRDSNSPVNPIICIGETSDENESGITKAVLKNQLIKIFENNDFKESKEYIIAYEPIWAIGTGKVPSANQINNIHSKIRLLLAKKIGHGNSNKISILYGGSVNAQNAIEILNLSQVDGALVGGASLKVSDFSKIIDSYK